MASSSSRRDRGGGRRRTSSRPARLRGVRAETDGGLAGEPDLFDRVSRGREERTTPSGDFPEHTLPTASPAGIPKSWVKFLVGFFLLAPAWILTRTFLQAFFESVRHGLLASRPFGCFAAGMLSFGILFLVIPRSTLMIPYVFGHEMTHALWVKLFGGKVADRFHVSLEGGHVMTDRLNTWIALSPYFFPFYSALLLSLYAAGSFVADLSRWNWILFLLLGFTLAFHLVFTILLIARGQPDLHYGGTFFSIMVIYLINLLILTLLLLVTGRDVTLPSLCDGFVRNGAEFVETCRLIAVWLFETVSGLVASLKGFSGAT